MSRNGFIDGRSLTAMARKVINAMMSPMQKRRSDTAKVEIIRQIPIP
ncbi:MAG: hypothetical protein AB2L14_19025 [Candidatus Xenobiia bacterium LiM19]